jgi:hypothetical protein
MNVPAALRAELGDDAAESLADMFASAQAQSDVRLAQEISSFRVEMHQGMAHIRHEVATSRVEILKWMIGLWMVHLSATIGIISFMLRR